MALGIRQAYRDVQAEENAQGWGWLLALVAAGTATWFTWSATQTPVATLLATIMAFPAGYWIGYRFARLFSILLGLTVLTIAVGIFISYQTAKKVEQEAVFDANSLSTTILRLQARGQQVAEVDRKNNEVLSKEALDELNRELARIEGAQVRWQALVESVTVTTVKVQGIGGPVPVHLELVADRQYPETNENSDPLVLPIRAEQSRKLVAGQPVCFTGRLLACRAERSGYPLVFTVRVSEVKVVD